uniref:hypothetical protein n=1 Tax=Thaumasiovibrio occultus TaxID=1891184 RepID=UPI00131B5542|nr:hypothetical protein [Thaumasiovibrio occultus]
MRVLALIGAVCALTANAAIDPAQEIAAVTFGGEPADYALGEWTNNPDGKAVLVQYNRDTILLASYEQAQAGVALGAFDARFNTCAVGNTDMRSGVSAKTRLLIIRDPEGQNLGGWCQTRLTETGGAELYNNLFIRRSSVNALGYRFSAKGFTKASQLADARVLTE